MLSLETSLLFFSVAHSEIDVKFISLGYALTWKIHFFVIEFSYALQTGLKVDDNVPDSTTGLQLDHNRDIQIWNELKLQQNLMEQDEIGLR